MMLLQESGFAWGDFLSLTPARAFRLLKLARGMDDEDDQLSPMAWTRCASGAEMVRMVKRRDSLNDRQWAAFQRLTPAEKLLIRDASDEDWRLKAAYLGAPE